MVTTLEIIVQYMHWLLLIIIIISARIECHIPTFLANFLLSESSECDKHNEKELVKLVQPLARDVMVQENGNSVVYINTGNKIKI